MRLQQNKQQRKQLQWRPAAQVKWPVIAPSEQRRSSLKCMRARPVAPREGLSCTFFILVFVVIFFFATDLLFYCLPLFFIILSLLLFAKLCFINEIIAVTGAFSTACSTRWFGFFFSHNILYHFILTKINIFITAYRFFFSLQHFVVAYPVIPQKSVVLEIINKCALPQISPCNLKQTLFCMIFCCLHSKIICAAQFAFVDLILLN